MCEKQFLVKRGIEGLIFKNGKIRTISNDIMNRSTDINE